VDAGQTVEYVRAFLHEHFGVPFVGSTLTYEVRCSVLQCVAVCRSVLQRVVLCHLVVRCVAAWFTWCGASQCVAVYCSVLQRVVVCCSVLQCVAV